MKNNRTGNSTNHANRRTPRDKRRASGFAALLAAALLLAAAPAARAHYLWATVEKGQARFALLDDLTAKPNPEFAFYVAKLAPRSGGRPVALGPAKDGARTGALPAAGPGVVSAESVVGVRDRGAGPYLLVYHPRGAASLAAAGGAEADAAAVLRARREGDTLVVAASLAGRPAPAGVEVAVQWPGDAGGAEATAKTGANGEARFPWKAGAPAGFVGARAMLTEKKDGTHDGQKYAAVHRWATLTFPVTAGNAVAGK